MTGRRVLGLVLMIAGAVLVAVGGVGLLGRGTEPASSPVATQTPVASAPDTPAATAPPTVLASEPPPPTPSATTSPPSAEPSLPSPSAVGTLGEATIRAFLSDLTANVRGGAAGALFDALHPAVLQVYGADACRAYLGTLNDPTFAIEVSSISGPMNWTWVTDDKSVAIADAYAISGTVTSAGKKSASQFHVAVAQGATRWFTDCGDPLAN